MTQRLECRCAAGPHSLGRHEPFCPVITGREWCEDCRRESCRCRPITVPIDHSSPDPWALPETRTA